MHNTIYNSTFCCFVILSFTTYVLSVDQCSADTEGNDVMSIEPYYVREIGGEQLIIDLPCQTKVIDDTSVKCRFESYPENIVDGERLGENQIACVTPVHIYLGIHQVYVSVDNGSSFDYVGRFYAESEYILEPHLVIEKFDSAILQDFTTDMEITLLWDKSMISSKFLTLNLMMIIDPFSKLKSWDESTVLIEKVENNGKISFKLSDVVSDVASNDIIGSMTIPITYGVLKLSAANTNVYIAGPTILITFTEIQYSVCDRFEPILEQMPVDILPCPCNTTQAKTDKYFNQEPPVEPFYHPGVDSCFRSVPSAYGSSEQCCYNSDGSLNLVSDGAGTSDTFSPEVSTIKHYVFDVLPWFVCCRMFERCDYYYKYRPSDDCSTYKPVEEI
ncbi:Sushi domain-containing protein 2 [Oopsacas minuta]|uniref:Sushi domain-containing protein 2 n=1 Tax=Oopsacas minuta TaxID=111878 RepID=A0AAV7JHG1_9METZ|nr:Sushi domain-containing protein 2 [Oopsacas minuta]